MVGQAWKSFRTVPVRLAEIDAVLTARSERLPLLTLDSGLIRAARRLGVRIVEVEQ